MEELIKKIDVKLEKISLILESLLNDIKEIKEKNNILLEIKTIIIFLLKNNYL